MPSAKTTKDAVKPAKPVGKFATVDAYLDALPDDRRDAMSTLRQTILKHLPDGYAEGIQYNMIGYFVPHTLYPHGYHCDPKQPLPFASIASQKNHMALYLFCIYTDPKLTKWFADAWVKAGCKLDMGKGCVRFKTLDDVPLKVVGQAIKKVPVKTFIASYESNLPANVKKKRGL